MGHDSLFSYPRRAYSPQITPKMCLLEWCRREKLAQPVYETVSSWLWPALRPALGTLTAAAIHISYQLQTAWLEPGFALRGPVDASSFPLT